MDFFPNDDLDDLSPVEIYVAGKDGGPDADAHAVAVLAIDDLGMHLEKLRGNFGICDADYDISEIWFPYQPVKMFFVRLLSEYGGELEYGIKLEDCRYGPRGVLHSSNSNDESIGSVPATVKGVLNWFEENNLADPELAQVRTEVREKKVMGIEILASLLRITERHREAISHSSHFLELLGHVQHHAT